jgi:hypothetical protein
VKNITIDSATSSRSLKVTIRLKLKSSDPQEIQKAIDEIDVDEVKRAMLAAVDSVTFIDEESDLDDEENVPFVFEGSTLDRARKATQSLNQMYQNLNGNTKPQS